MAKSKKREVELCHYCLGLSEIGTTDTGMPIYSVECCYPLTRCQWQQGLPTAINHQDSCKYCEDYNR